MKPTLAVAAICHGTVIDHIEAGCALPIVNILRLVKHSFQMTLGLNLPSARQEFKDIIKIQNRLLREEEIYAIAIFAAGATINLVNDFTIIEKIIVTLPPEVVGIFQCLNPNCVSIAKDVLSKFYVTEQRGEVQLHCHYCERTFQRSQLHESHL